MKDGGWIPIDKRLLYLLPKTREYTFIEAYISFAADIESATENSINGYSRMWSWSRNKVRCFIEKLRTGKGHVVDNQRTGKGQEIRLIFNNLKERKDSQGTVKGQAKDRQGTITIDPNPNTIEILEIISDLNRKGGFRYQANKTTDGLINGRLSEGFTKDDFFMVHSNMIAKWKSDSKMCQYLRPDTLYRPSKFQGYLNMKLAEENAACPSWY